MGINKLTAVSLVASFLVLTPIVNDGQQPAPVAGAAQASHAEKSAALPEALRLSVKVVELFKAGKLDEALPLAERALEIRERELSANDRLIADALVNVAALRLTKKDYDKAEVAYRRALAIYETSGEQNGGLVIATLDRLIFLSASKGNFDKAATLAQQLVTLAEKKYRPDQLEMALALTSLAEVYRLQLNNKQARATYARIVDIVEKYAPSAVPKVITLSLSNYLTLLYAEERGKNSSLTERINKLFISIASAAPPGHETEIQGGVLNGKAVHKPQPSYPPEARQAHAQGTVVVRVTVDETGKVIEAKAINDLNSNLLRASESAARQWRFTPTLLSGTPVKVIGTITFKFLLQ